MTMILDLYNVLDTVITADRDPTNGREYTTLTILHSTHVTEITLYPDTAETSVTIHDERSNGGD